MAMVLLAVQTFTRLTRAAMDSSAPRSGQGHRDDRQVGEDQRPTGRERMRSRACPEPDRNVDCRYDERGGRCYPDIYLELVAHRAALHPRRGDGRVGDEAEVVAEERAANDKRRHHRDAKPGLLCDAGSNGDQRDDGAYAGADGHGNEACGKEQPRKKEFPREDGEGQVHGGLDRAYGLGRAGKCPGEDEYPYHQEDVLVASAFGENAYPLFQAPAPYDEKRVDRRQQEGGRDWHLVEVMRNQRRDKVDDQENQYGA